MKCGLVLSVVLCAALGSVMAQTPVRDLQAGATEAGGGGSSMPVNVVNLPMNEDGALTTSGMIATRIIDLLPDGGVEIGITDIWKSEPFDTRLFDTIAFQGSLFPDAINAEVDCRIEWQIESGEFSVVAFNSAINGARGQGITLTYGDDFSCDNWDVFDATDFPCYHRMSVLQPVNGTRARVACKGPYGPELGGEPAELISMKVMLRRG